MPSRKHTPDFTACTQFGRRYSSLGKRIAASDPYREGENPREVTSTMNLYELCEALDIELTEEQAEKEAEYIYENRRQYYKNHPYMEKKAIAQCYDGPVFPDDVVYRRSNCEKYTVQADGSIINTSGTVVVKQPNWEGFVHTPPKQHEKVATFTKGMPRKTNDKSPAITLPKQANPLMKGEYKTRTPQEASKAAAKQREQARKEAAKTIQEEKDCETCPSRGNTHSYIKGYEDAKKELCTEEEKQTVREHYLGELTDVELAEECKKRGITPDISLIPTDGLREEINRRMDSPQLITRKTAPIKVLNAFPDASLADELRRRGYTVTATKTIEI